MGESVSYNYGQFTISSCGMKLVVSVAVHFELRMLKSRYEVERLSESLLSHTYERWQ